MESKKLISFEINLCSDKYILKLNNKFLRHDYFTDILTFDLSDNKDYIEGVIYISVDRVLENSKQLNENKETELYRVIIHGLLHLIGYCDETKKQKSNMRKLENRYLDLI
ncbi:MAG: rRNA maturation RNase YbeY [Bacteroidia bacterium]|nr:rRNA maturation RNase YbeY [Bacteroidia bacterium]